MDDEAILAQLEDAARKLSVRVRYEECGVLGGLCTLHGEQVVIMDRRAEASVRARVLARALREVGTEGLYLSPVVRDLIEQA